MLLTLIRQDIKGLVYHRERPWLNVHHIATHFTWQGNGKADLCKHKANKPQGEVIYWDRYCQRHQWNTSLVLNHRYNNLLLLNTELDQLVYVVSEAQSIKKDFGNFFLFFDEDYFWEIRLIPGFQVPLIPGCNLQYCHRKRNAVSKVCVQWWFHCCCKEGRLQGERGVLELLSILEASEKTWGGKDSMLCAGHGWGKTWTCAGLGGC